MLTRTVRRVYGSMQVGSSTSAVDAERPRRPSDGTEVLRVVEPLEHGHPAGRRRERRERRGGRRRCPAAIAPRWRSKPTIIVQHGVVDEVDRGVDAGQQSRPCGRTCGRSAAPTGRVTRGDHALDRHRALGDEQFVTLDPAAGDGVLELAIVGQSGIVGVVDPLWHAAQSRRGVDRSSAIRANIEHVFWQASLFGACAPAVRRRLRRRADRRQLDATSWVEHAPGWLRGADQLLDELVDAAAAPPAHRRADVRPDRRRAAAVGVVAEQPRAARTVADPDARCGTCSPSATTSRSTRSASTSTATVTTRSPGTPTGTPRSSPIRSSRSSASARRVRSGCDRRVAGASLSWDLGNGDLFVMGGACQHDWEHTRPQGACHHRPAPVDQLPLRGERQSGVHERAEGGDRRAPGAGHVEIGDQLERRHPLLLVAQLRCSSTTRSRNQSRNSGVVSITPPPMK